MESNSTEKVKPTDKTSSDVTPGFPFSDSSSPDKPKLLKKKSLVSKLYDHFSAQEKKGKTEF